MNIRVATLNDIDSIVEIYNQLSKPVKKLRTLQFSLQMRELSGFIAIRQIVIHCL